MFYFVLAVQGVVVLTGLVIYGTLIMTIFTHAPYVPARKRELARFLHLADIKEGERVIDLGSGDGRIVLAAACAGAQAVGIERQPALVWISRFRAWRQGVSARAQFVRGNIFKADLSNVNVVFCYLLPGAMDKLRAKLEREVPSGARVISNAFHIEGWTPSVVDRDGLTAPLFLYNR